MNEMQTIETVKILASVVGGGAAGALITSLVTGYRNRLQPIYWRSQVVQLFSASRVAGSLTTSITFADGENSASFDNLYLVEVHVSNRGNRDMPTFAFGLTFGEADKVIHVVSAESDRHHTSTFSAIPTPNSHSRLMDLVLTPFNRRDVYSFKIFVVAGEPTPPSISISSSEPVKFVDLVAVADSISSAGEALAPPAGLFFRWLRRLR